MDNTLLTDLVKGVENLTINQHILNQRLPQLIDVKITPTEGKKSKNAQTFMDLIDMFGLGRKNIVERVEVYESTDSDFIKESLLFDFYYNWSNNHLEESCYLPFITHFKKLDIQLIDVHSGQDLPGGLVFDVKLYTLKTNASVSSKVLKSSAQNPIHKFDLSGRTDVIRVKRIDRPIGHSNIKYFVECKRNADFSDKKDVEECLKEGVLQLIGINASNTLPFTPRSCH